MPLPTDQLHKEIDLIQALIARMAQNSFQIKAWLIGVLSATVALGKDNLLVSSTNGVMAYIFNTLLVVSIVSFWYLDAYYLNAERRYRKLYVWVLKNRAKTDEHLYDLETFTRKIGKEEQQIDEGIGNVIQEMRNKTLLFFYLTPFVLVAGLFVYNLNVQSKQTPPPKKKVEQMQVKTSKQQTAVPKPDK